MNVTYFFRKPFTDYFSIEELFAFIQSKLSKNVIFKNHYMKKMSNGFYNRLYNCIEVISHQGDINHITGDVHYISYFMKKSRTVLTIHDLVPLTRGKKINRKIIKLFWYTLPSKRVKYITVISEFTKNQLLEFVNVDPEKIVVIYDCISPEIKYFPKEFNKVKPNILQMGTAHNKNLENVIPAITGLNVKLTIIGHLTDDQINLLNQYKVEYENNFNLSYSEIIEQYKKADIVMFTSKYEGFGLPIIEANGTGRAVITSNLASMPEVAGDSAILINPYDISEIRNAVNKLITDTDFRDNLIKKGLNNVKRFTAESIAEKYTELYSKMINKMN